jgi:hypothetical protein
MDCNNLSIICPTAGYPNLVRSLETYKKYAPGAKVIVVDQTEKGALLRPQIEELTHAYLWVYRTLGFAKAMNMGIELSDTEYVCCANDDVELVNIRWWQPILEWFEKDPSIAGVNPASIKGYTNESDHLPCDCPGEKEDSTGNCLVCRAYKKEYTEDDYDYFLLPREVKAGMIKNINSATKVDGIMTWFTVFKRSALDRIKRDGCYYDEHFYPGGGEDYDLMCRMYDERGPNIRHRVIGVYNTWAYHQWFGTRIKNPPKIIAGLRWNDVDGKYNRKEGDPEIFHDGKSCISNWDLWGRKNKSIPIPPCVKVPL